jgi:hypothetical protein
MIMIKVKQHFALDLYETGNEIVYPKEQTTALGLWLILAYNNPDISPLWFADQGIVASSKRDGVMFNTPGMAKEIFVWADVEKLLKEISELSYDEYAFYTGLFPKINEYRGTPDFDRGVYEKDEVFTFYIHGKPTIPIGLRYWVELDVWYGVIAANQDTPEPYLFNDLSAGQI